MPREKRTAEEIVSRLRQIEMLAARPKTPAERAKSLADGIWPTISMA